jgi:hypothetical protein
MQSHQGMYHPNNQVSTEMKRIVYNGSIVDNRPRVSKSMDHCMLSPTSFSGHGMGNLIVAGYQNIGNWNPVSVQNHLHMQHVFYPQQQQIHQLSSSGSNHGPSNSNFVLSSSKTLQKQADVDS